MSFVAGSYRHNLEIGLNGKEPLLRITHGGGTSRRRWEGGSRYERAGGGGGGGHIGVTANTGLRSLLRYVELYLILMFAMIHVLYITIIYNIYYIYYIYIVLLDGCRHNMCICNYVFTDI